MADLAGLIDKVKAATGEDREIDWLVAERFGIPEPWLETTMWPGFIPGSKRDKYIPPFSGSIDAVVALAEEVLPGALRAVIEREDGWLASITIADETRQFSFDDFEVAARTPALALLRAIITELLSRRSATAEPVAFIERAVLDQLAKYKDATGAVASGLLKRPFGDPVPLYAAPPAAQPAALEAAEALASMADYYDAKSAETMSVALKLRFDSSARRLRELAKALADGSALASPTITDEMVERAAQGLNKAGCDWIAANRDGSHMGIGWADVPDEVFARGALLAVLGGKHD